MVCGHWVCGLGLPSGMRKAAGVVHGAMIACVGDSGEVVCRLSNAAVRWDVRAGPHAKSFVLVRGHVLGWGKATGRWAGRPGLPKHLVVATILVYLA